MSGDEQRREESKLSTDDEQLKKKFMEIMKDTKEPTKPFRDDAKLAKLQQQLDDCSKKAHTFLYTSISVGASVPMIIFFKTMKPLYVLPLLGGAVDFYKSYQTCLSEREALDTYMLKRRRWELITEKKRLEMERDALLDELKRR